MDGKGFIRVRWVFVGAALLLLAFGAGTARGRTFVAQTGQIAAQTFRDAFGARRETPILEIDVTEDIGVSRDGSAARLLREVPSAPLAPRTAPSDAAPDLGAPVRAKAAQRASVAAAPILSVPAQSSGTSAASPHPLPSAECDFGSGGAPHQTIVINEVAWMGTGASAHDEWLELKNNSAADVSLSGSRLASADQDIAVVFREGDAIPAGGFFLLERTDDDSVPSIPAGRIYTGALSNAGAHLKLFDADCGVADELDASAGWSARGGDNATKQTLERSRSGGGWQTSASPGGTPGRENSAGAAPPPPSSAPSSSSPLSLRHHLTVLKSGDGRGRVTSAPAGVDCGPYCVSEFAAGTAVSLAAAPDGYSEFRGWSGACAGVEACTPTMNGDAVVTASFALQSAPPPSAATVLVSEIMAGSAAENGDEFVELYNASGADVDLTGWSLKKKTSSGAESLLVAASRLTGKTIRAGGYFLIAHEGGYGGSVPPDVTWPPSYALAYTNNAVVLYDANGEAVEEVAWTEIPKDQSYERESWASGLFRLNPAPTPRNSGS